MIPSSTLDCAYTGHYPTAHLDELPFIFNTGTTVHISPEASDFKVLRSILSCPVKGLCSSAVHAVSVGDIELCIAGGHTLKLIDILYIPECTVWLISILALNRGSWYMFCFTPNGCWIQNKSGTVLMCGAISESKKLYILTTNTPFMQHCKSVSNPSHSVLVTRIPNIETWHCHLGHCNMCAIIEMAKNNVSQGMPIDLSLLPPKCDHCVLGKQLCSLVPKIWEGTKMSRHLDWVYVDLCGLMAIMSQSGKLYCMNIIDDFSGYAWSIPLHSKSDALPALQSWHKAVTVQTRKTL